MALTDWDAVLLKVDSTPPKAEKLRMIVEALLKRGWTRPELVIQSTGEEVLESLGTDVKGPDAVFVRRAVLWINDADRKAKALENAVVGGAESVVPLASQGTAEHAASMHSLLGNETSALAVADAIAAGRDSVDVSQTLEDAELGAVTDDFCPSKDLLAALGMIIVHQKPLIA